MEIVHNTAAFLHLNVNIMGKCIKRAGEKHEKATGCIAWKEGGWIQREGRGV